MVGDNGDGLHRDTKAFSRAVGQAGETCGDAENPNDGGPEDITHRGGVASGSVGARDTAGAVRGSGQGDAHRGIGRAIDVLAGVADSVDIGVGGAHEAIDGDAARGTEFESGVLGEFGVGDYANAEDESADCDGLAGFELSGKGLAVLLNGDDFVSDTEVDALSLQFLSDRRGHLGVHQGEDLRGAFDEDDVHTTDAELLGHFEPDVAPANDQGALLLKAFEMIVDGVGVIEIAQREDAGEVLARDIRDDRAGARREDELVVGQVEFFACGVVVDTNGLVRTVDADGFMPWAHVDAESLAEKFCGGDDELGAVGDLSAEVVRQSAVGEGDVVVFLE